LPMVKMLPESFAVLAARAVADIKEQIRKRKAHK
jgi:hypothetical protein